VLVKKDSQVFIFKCNNGHGEKAEIEEIFEKMLQNFQFTEEGLN